MTTIRATVVADSISPEKHRLTTMLLRYPRWIHAEGRTHRHFRIGEEFPTPSVMEDPNLSRNASSSRAIPVERLIEDVLRDPAIPMFWGANQRGMQAGAECDAFIVLPLLYREATRERAWLWARDQAIESARAFAEAGYHKQIVNRLLEPFSHINVVVTATEWSNFFALRDHADAEPHIRLLARRMKTAMADSHPRALKPGEWHLPFVDMDKHEGARWSDLIPLSVARCARTSYLTHDQRPPVDEEDRGLAHRLLGAVPLHASPAEHQATPDERLRVTSDRRDWDEVPGFRWKSPEHHGNFKGFIQYRKTLVGECQ